MYPTGTKRISEHEQDDEKESMARFKMRLALEVYKEDKTLSQVASENGVAPSLAA
jgi:hypothetical protein